METNREVRPDQLSGLILLLISIYIIIESLTFKDLYDNTGTLGPHVFPMAVAIILAICGLLLLFNKEKRDKSVASKNIWYKNKRFLLASLFILIYYLLLDIIGYPIATILFLFSLSRLLYIKWQKSIILSIVLTGILYLLFGFLLEVPLPGFYGS